MRFSHALRLSLNSCCLCNEPCEQAIPLCETCRHDLPAFKHLGEYSSHTLAHNSSHASYLNHRANLLLWPAIHKLFASCQFEQLIAVSPYLWPYTHWLHQLKYKVRFDLAPLIATLLADAWRKNMPEYAEVNEMPTVLSVPLHPSKWQQRGYNQAHLLASEFAKKMNYVYQPYLLSRIKKTEEQVGKSGAERRRNLRNAFAVNTPKQRLPKNVILIDDVITTGTTCNEVTKLLKKSGVEHVTVLSLCIALP